MAPILEQGKQYDYPFLGILSIGELTLLQQEALSLPRSTGVYVTVVVPGGPADLAGLRAGNRDSNLPGLPAGGDLIIAFDGKPVATYDELLSYLITTKSPGDTVVLTVLRNGESVDVTITLGARPHN